MMGGRDKHMVIFFIYSILAHTGITINKYKGDVMIIMVVNIIQ